MHSPYRSRNELQLIVFPTKHQPKNFKFPIADRGIYDRVQAYWKRYTITQKGPIDFGGIGHKFHSFDAVASLHPVAEQVIAAIDERYPLFKDAPTSIYDLGGRAVTGLEEDFPINF